MSYQPDGQLLLGGLFARLDGITRNRIACVNGNGTLDAACNPSANSNVLVFALQPNGKLVFGGIFNRMGDVVSVGSAHLNSDGGLDIAFSFNPPADSAVCALVAHTERSKLAFGGKFTRVDGSNDSTRMHIARPQ